MPERTKRTYSLRSETMRRVRELAERGFASSQDAIVDAAVDRLYREAREREEASAWAAAADDPQLREEVEQIAAGFDRSGPWPE